MIKFSGFVLLVNKCLAADGLGNFSVFFVYFFPNKIFLKKLYKICQATSKVNDYSQK
jgi:hypothetical protein